jgi:hypothetical protein
LLGGWEMESNSVGGNENEEKDEDEEDLKRVF